MIVDLVNTTSPDGMRLDGALHSASSNSSANAHADAIICLHGVGSNFYSSTLMEEITPPMLDLGLAVLWANTRGHDGLNTALATPRRRRQGAAYEVVDECRYDVAAWAEFLAQRGFARLVLLGHSLGAIKAVYALAQQPIESVASVIAISPPRLSYTAFNNGPSASAFFEAISLAQRHVAEGRPETLIEVDFPFPLLITAAGYVDKYGPRQRYNILKFAHRITCPVLFCYGDLELEQGGVAFAGLPDALAALPWPRQPCQVASVPGANHVYTGKRPELASHVVKWLCSDLGKL